MHSIFQYFSSAIWESPNNISISISTITNSIFNQRLCPYGRIRTVIFNVKEVIYLPWKMDGYFEIEPIIDHFFCMLCLQANTASWEYSTYILKQNLMIFTGPKAMLPSMDSFSPFRLSPTCILCLPPSKL